MPEYVLAQLNIAHLAASIDSPELAEFVDNLDPMNALAEASPGFIWRLQTDDGNATALRPFGDDYIVNLSVWRDVESLFDYVYRSAHTPFLGRRKAWFKHMREPYTVLWWVPRGHHPDPSEAQRRLMQLRTEGPTQEAFTFKCRFPAPDA